MVVFIHGIVAKQKRKHPMALKIGQQGKANGYNTNQDYPQNKRRSIVKNTNKYYCKTTEVISAEIIPKSKLCLASFRANSLPTCICRRVAVVTACTEGLVYTPCCNALTHNTEPSPINPYPLPRLPIPMVVQAVLLLS